MQRACKNSTYRTAEALWMDVKTCKKDPTELNNQWKVAKTIN